MNAERPPVIHILDDEESLRVSLARLLEQAGYAVRSHASAGDFLLAEPDDGPACLLLDLALPGGPSGLDLQEALRRRGRTIPIVFMSAYGDVPHTVRAIKGGATDFLVKPIDAQTLLAAIESALAVVAPPAAGHAPHAGRPAPALTERERVVLRGIAAGRLNKQLAADLQLSERTIKSCRAEVMRKLGARSFAELMRLAAPLLDD
jgi:FixJ family two-component response regulator